jgi:hypothetical protein
MVSTCFHTHMWHTLYSATFVHETFILEYQQSFLLPVKIDEPFCHHGDQILSQFDYANLYIYVVGYCIEGIEEFFGCYIYIGF